MVSALGLLRITSYNVCYTKLLRARKAGTGETLNPKHKALLDKVRQGSATSEEQKAFRAHHEAASVDILARAPQDIFTITEVEILV